MNYRSLSLPVALLSAPLAALVAPRDEVRFAPAPDAVLQKTFETTLDLDLGEIMVLFDGDDEGMPEIAIATEWRRAVTVTDGFHATRAGAPTRLRRAFDELEQTLEYACTVTGQGVDLDVSGTSTGHSGLSEAVVAFERDEESEAYVKTFVDMEADAALLEGLREDMDLRALLPEDPVADGDEWSIDPDAFALILEPGGDLAFEMDVEDLALVPPIVRIIGPFALVLVPPGEMLGEAEGEVTGRFTGTREEDGARLGVIELRAEIETRRDLAAALNEAVQDALPPGAEVTVHTADLTFAFEGRGELLWNLDAGHLHALDLSGEVTVHLDREVEGRMGEDAGKIETTLDMTGTYTQTVTIE